jgi:hypothetical protein
MMTIDTNMFDVLKAISYDIPSMVGIIIAIGFFLRHLRFLAENSKADREANRDVMIEVASVLKDNARALGSASEAFHGAEEFIRRAQQNENNLKKCLETNTHVIERAIQTIDKAETTMNEVKVLIKGEYHNA